MTVRNPRITATTPLPGRHALGALLVGLAALAPQAAFAADIIPPKVYATSPTGVNIADGSFTYTHTDLSIGTLSLDRFHLYSPSTPYDPNTMFFGDHTSHNFDIYVSPTFAQAQPPFPAHPKPIVHFGMSASGVYHQANFLPSASISPGSLDAYRGSLQYPGGTYVYTDQDWTIYTFNPSVQVAGIRIGANAPYSQRIASIAYLDGRVRSFTYSAGKLKMVSDSTGYAIIFDYGGNGLVSAACGFNLSQTYVTASSTCAGAALAVSYNYAYDTLTSVTDVLGQTTTYAYSTNFGRYITCITPPGAATCQIANNYPSDQTLQQTLADGAVWNFAWSSLMARDIEYVPGEGVEEAYVTDPDGQVSSYRFTGTSPYSATDPNGNTTNYVFSGSQDLEDIYSPPLNYGSTLVEATHPEGNRYLAEYNGPYRAVSRQIMQAKPGSGLADSITSYGYDLSGSGAAPFLPKPIWIRDANGNQTDLTYASHGGVLTEMQPAPSAGAARPLKVVTYAQRYAYIRNAGGTLVPAAAAVWQPASETLCQTAAASSTPACDAAAPQTVTTFEYGANGTADNLLLRGQVVSDGTTSRRTCFGYDPRGNRISETQPRAGLSSCP